MDAYANFVVCGRMTVRSQRSIRLGLTKAITTRPSIEKKNLGFDSTFNQGTGSFERSRLMGSIGLCFESLITICKIRNCISLPAIVDRG